MLSVKLGLHVISANNSTVIKNSCIYDTRYMCAYVCDVGITSTAKISYQMWFNQELCRIVAYIPANTEHLNNIKCTTSANRRSNSVQMLCTCFVFTGRFQFIRLLSLDCHLLSPSTAGAAYIRVFMFFFSTLSTTF